MIRSRWARTVSAVLLISALLTGCGSASVSDAAEESQLQQWGAVSAAPALAQETVSVSQQPAETAADSDLETEADSSAGDAAETAETTAEPEAAPEVSAAETDADPNTEPGTAAETSAAPETTETGQPEASASVTAAPAEPSATAAPAESVESGLAEALRAEVATCSGTWGLYFKNLGTGEEISIDGDSPMVAASLIKLYVAGACYQQGLSAGNESDLEPMITTSDNDACNRLVTLLGGGTASNGEAVVTSFAQGCGYTATEMNRLMLETSAMENYTSPRNCGQVLEAIYNGTYVSAEASETLMGYLKAQTRTGKIPAGVPDGVVTANKTGELSDVENDAAIVFSPGGDYILCIMSDGVTSGVAVNNIIGISRLVYNYLNPS